MRNGRTVSFLAFGLSALSVAPARAQAPDIAHDAVSCIVVGKYPKLKACFTPAAQVAKARVYFRREDRPVWYHVEMASEEACFVGTLPRPTRELLGMKVPYYVEVANQRLDMGRTQEHGPEVVQNEGECKTQAVAPYVSQASVKVFPDMPPGFSAGGLGARWIAGGAAAIGIGVGVLAGGSNNPTITPTPAPGTGPGPTVPPTAPPSTPPSVPPTSNGPPSGVFAVSPDPPAGTAPMAVRFNLCRSTDPDNDPLVFRYDFGDGQRARGSCREEHIYEAPTNGEGGYRATACVGDGRPDHEQCQAFNVKVAAAPPPPPGAQALTVALGGPGAGNVTSDPGGIDCPGTCSANYPSGTTVTLRATAAAGSSFAGWSVPACGTSATCPVTMTSAQSVTATFNTVTVTFPLTVTLAGSGTGRVTSDTGGIDCPGVCTASYASGTTVTLQAQAGPGSTFAGWSQASCGTAATCPVPMTSAQSVTATFNTVTVTFPLTVTLAGSGTGRVTSDTGGIDCPGVCTASYPSGTLVTLRAAAGVGSTFAGWSVTACGTAPTCQVAMTSPQSVTATFTAVPTTFPLTVNLSGSGSGDVNSTPGGISCPESCTASYPSGTPVTLRASPSGGSVFIGWSVASCGAQPTCTVTMTGPQTVTATFELQTTGRRITLGREGNGLVESDVQPGIVCGDACSYPSFADGSTVVLTQTPDMGWSFNGWGGDCSGTGRTCTLVMTQDWVVTATFNPPSTPADRRSSSMSWISDLRVPRGRGQVVVNQRAWEVGSGQQRTTMEAAPGEGRVEATLTQAAGAGLWRFELADGMFEPGTLRAVEGKVEALMANAVVFRLTGKAGERVMFVYRVAKR